MAPDGVVTEQDAEASAGLVATRYATAADALLAKYQGFMVTTDDGWTQAGEEQKQLREQLKDAEEQRDSWVRPLNAQVKRVNDLFRRPKEVLEQVINILSRARLAYEAKKQAEADRIRREQEEAARKEQARLDKLAADRAARAEAKGDLEKAEEIRQTVPQVPLPIPSMTPILPKVQGIAKQQYWFAEVTDLHALVTAVAAGEVPMEAVLANDAWLKKTASALKTAMKYPGVRVRDEWREKGTGR